MKLLLNDKEILHFLLKNLDYTKYIENIPLEQNAISECISWIHHKKRRPLTPDIKLKIKTKIHKSVHRDVSAWYSNVKEVLENEKRKKTLILKNNFEKILNQIGEDVILEKYKNSTADHFVKSLGLYLDSQATLVRRKKYNNPQEECLFRNLDGNEQLVLDKINNRYPFWFVDTGYTNFLHGKNKKWHRLVRNHIHWGGYFRSPVDRLINFPSFPQPWREAGDRILIIEPGPFAAKIFKVDIAQWKYNIEAELRKYTDKKIVFREKVTKKQRAPLYKHLLDEDYYCVININSNAAVESLWAGIPVITLDRHITNQVSRNQIKSINDLYRGSLAEWLAMLSYSQFTYEELIDGTAYRLLTEQGNA